MLKKLLSFLIIILSSSAISNAQGSGTPNQLRIKLDANNYLILSAVAQTAPLSQPTLFSNARLKTDSNGYLVVTIPSFTGSTNNYAAVFIVPDGNNKDAINIRGAGNGIIFHNNADLTCFGSILSGTSPNRMRLTTCNSDPLVLQENGGQVQYTKLALATSSADSYLIQNTTAATGGATVQMSPRLRFRGTAWDTATSQIADMWWEILPQSGATIGSYMRLGFDNTGSGSGVISYPVHIGTFPSAVATYSALWFGTSSPSTTNFSFLAANASNQTIVNTGSGSIELRVANTTHFNMNTAGVEINGSSNATPTIPLLIHNAANNATLTQVLDNGQTLISFPQITAGTDDTTVTTGDVTRVRYQATITPASGGAGNCATQVAGFKAAATTADCVIATLPAGVKLIAAYADVTAGFTCSSVCSGTKTFGAGISAGGVEIFAAGLNVAATGQFGLADANMGTLMVRAAQIQGGYLPNWSGTTTITARFTSGTGNWGNGTVTTVNAGSIKFTLITELVK